MKVEKRINEIINRLNKTKKEEKNPDLRGRREERDRKMRENEKARLKEQRRLEKEEMERLITTDTKRISGTCIF